MAWVNAIASTILVLGLIASALGYRHSLKRFEYSPEWFFAMGKVLLAAAFGVRLLFWDVIWGMLRLIDRNAAIALSDAMGGTSVNIAFIVVGFGAVYCSLKARQMLLRIEEQKYWHWTIAWAHPTLLGVDVRRFLGVVTRR